MKKRVLSIVICALMLVGLLPTTALAVETYTNPKVIVNNTAMMLGDYLPSGRTAVQVTEPDSGGYAHLYEDNGTLTLELNNADFTNGGIVLEGSNEATLTIKLVGDNTISGAQGTDVTVGLLDRYGGDYNGTNITFSGAGSLTATGGEGEKDVGIFGNGDITVENGVTITASGGGYGIRVGSGFSSSGSVRADGGQYGIMVTGGGITITGGTLEASGNVKALQPGVLPQGDVACSVTPVMVGEDAASAGTWDNATALTTYKYVKIGTAQTPTESHDDHPICGATHDDIGDHTGDCEAVEWTEWTDATSLPSVAGNYYLTVDVTISGTWYPANGTVLCLNGHSITRTGTGSVIQLYANRTFTLTDCGSGKITGGSSGVGFMGKGNFYMYGGSFTGVETTFGGGVYVSVGGSFTMYGGSITDNSATQNGGGVYMTDGTFTMHGGRITDNTANFGGGVYMTGGTFTMSGGSITGNTANESGGGVYIDGGTFTMSGGSITGNTAPRSNGYGGGGVYFKSGTFTMSGGSITGNTTTGTGGGGVFVNSTPIKISGSPVITGNTKSGSENNVYGNSAFITVTGALDEDAEIGVTTSSADGSTLTKDSATNLNSINDADIPLYFTSDIAGLEIVKDTGGELVSQKVPTYTVTFNANGHGTAPDAIPDVLSGSNIVAPAAPEASGWTFVGWYKEAGCTTPWDFDADTVTDNITLYAKWLEKHEHNNCGDTGCTADHDCSNTSFLSWDGTDTDGETEGIQLTAGSWYLADNVTLTETLTIPSGTVNLCLNGFSITAGDNDAIAVAEGTALNICDCKDGGTISGGGEHGCGIKSEGDTVNVYGGTISSVGKYGYGIYNEGGTVNVYGGTVSGTGEDGYGISNSRHDERSSTVNIYDGVVNGEYCGIENYYTDSILNICGGTINGGIENLQSASINISNGTITGVVKNGEGCFLNISDGTVNGVIDNMRSENLTVTGGTIGAISSDESFTLSGAPTIKGEWPDDMAEYFGFRVDIFLINDSIIIGEGGLSNTDPYAVATASTPAEDATVPITSGAETVDYSSKFVAADSNYVVQSVQNDSTYQVVLAVRPLATPISGTVSIGGEAVFGGTLTADYSGDETVTYQWYRDGAEISGATGSTYTLTADDIGKTVKVVVTGTGDYNGSAESAATAAVEKADSAVNSVPTDKDITYTGSAQELVDAGSANGGEMWYALGADDTTPADGWSTDIPKGTDVGTYYVWYKVVGDECHKDTAPACITVTINAAVPSTYTVTYLPGAYGTGSEATDTKTERVDLELRGEIFTRTGYTQTGWATADGGAKVYELNGTYSDDAPASLYPVWTVKTYSVTLNADGATINSNDVTGYTYGIGATLPAAGDMTKVGYRFDGWYETADFSGSAVTDISTTATGDKTYYAKWTEVHNITGAVKDSDGVGIAGVTVKLIQGNTKLAEAITAVGGVFEFNLVPLGSYNVVAEVNTGNGIKTKTELVIIEHDDRELTIVMPNENVSSVLEVDVNSPDIVVGGLDEEAVENADDNSHVSIGMSIEKQDDAEDSGNEEVKTQQDAIKDAAGDAQESNLIFLEIKVQKTTTTDGVAGAPEPIDQTSTVLELIIPYDMKDKNGVTVYRYHDGQVKVMVKISERPLNGNSKRDATFYLDEINNLIYVYTDKFSTYAISHNEAGIYTVTLDPNGGTVTTTTLNTDASGKLASLPDAVRDGYTFTGWNTAADGSGTKVTVDTVFDKDATVYAQWSDTGSPEDESGSYTPTYAITVKDTENGAVKVNRSYAAGGRTVTITADPEDGYQTDTVTVTDERGNTVELTDRGDETYTFKMPNCRVTVTAVFTPEEDDSDTDVDSPEEHVCPSEPYTDVDQSLWYHEYIDYAIENGLMIGTGETEFEPLEPITRAMVVTVLHRLEGEPVVDYLMQYDDVANDMWYTEAIRWATSAGIVEGNGDGTFEPDTAVTREQLAAILHRCAMFKGIDVSVGENTNILSFDDAFDISDWAYPALQWACGTRLMEGNGDGTLNPLGETLRCEFAAMLMRFCEEILK